MMETITLGGRKKYLLSCEKTGFLVKSGSVDVSLQPFQGDRPARRLYLGTAEAGDWIPAPQDSHIPAKDGTRLNAVYLLSSENEAVIEEVRPESEWTENFRAYLNGSLFSLAGRTDYDEKKASGTQSLWDHSLAMYKKRFEQEADSLSARRREKEEAGRKVNEGLSRVFQSRFQYRTAQEKQDGGLFDAVAFLCAYRRIPCVPFESLKKSCENHYKLEDIARLSGFPVRKITLPDRLKRNMDDPLLCFLKKDGEEHPAVLYSRFGKLYLFDAGLGKERRFTDADQDSLQPDAVAFDRPLGDGPVALKEMLAFCMKEISISDVVLLAACALILAQVGIAFSRLNQQMYGEIIPSGEENLAWGAGMVFLAAVISSFLFSIAQSLTDYRIGIRLKNSIQLAIFHRVFHLPENFFHEREGAAQAYRISVLSGTYSSLLKTGTSVCLQIIFAARYLDQMFSSSSALAFIGLAAAFLQVVVTVLFGILLRKSMSENTSRTAKIRSFLYQVFSGIGTIRTSGAESAVLGQYMDYEVLLQRNQKKRNSFSNILSVLTSLISSACVLILYYTIGSGMGKSVSLGVFMGFISINTMFTNSLTGITNQLTSLYSMKPLLKDAGEYLSTRPESSHQGIILKDFTGDISLSHVTFAYTGSNKIILQDLSVHFHPGEYVGIAGSSGCGKSTLLRLILGFEKPMDGQIYYDDVSQDRLNLPELRQKIGTVLQDGALITGDLFENITVSTPDASHEQVSRAVETVGMTEEINAMPMGLMTHVSEETLTISGGQKQRILIARAIVGQPRVLLFDEATSSLDNLSQQAISDALKTLHATRIVVAHRLSTLELCDRILVMDQGKIVEEGTYQELIERKGKFYEMVQVQQAV